MNTREQLNQYLRGLESRFRILLVSRGLAVAFGVALGATLALVLIANAFAFSSTSMVVARITLYLSLAVAIGLGLVIPLMKLNQRKAAGKAEAAHPEFQQRLMTYLDRRDAQDPMLELLAEDTLKRAPKAAASKIVPRETIVAFATSAGGALLVLLWLILAEGGFMHFGARTLWAGTANIGTGGAFYQVLVNPGDETVRRRTDVQFVATLQGFQAPQVRLMAKYQNSAKWDELTMEPRPGEASYGFLLAAVPEQLEYYVEAAGVKSKTYTIKVVDLPGVKSLKVTYHYPSWMGAKDMVEDPGGDLRAVVGTTAELTVETDKPLTGGLVELQDGKQIELQPGQGNILTASVPIEKQGMYHFAAKSGSDVVRLTPDYFIEAQEDAGPKVKISHPQADAKVNPLEEVAVTVEASDDFGVMDMKLHYSVNGEPEKVVSLLNAKGGKTAEGKYTLYLEDLKLVPGDSVSMYATAKDARTETTSEISFIEAQPFEKNYSQSQQGGGGGGGGGDQQQQTEISKRQRDIIALTHNALRGTAQDKAAATKERASFLAETQSKLKEQAKSLAERIQARQLDGASSSIKDFVAEIEAAAKEMGPAADMLGGASWEKALVPEQKALQHLQRAEQMNRDIQVAFGNQGGGGGGGGGGNAGRDLANLFDLELDTEKNQYEQAQQASGSGAEQQQKAQDDALEKLKQLAHRQEELANGEKNSKQQQAEKRWEQETLMRQAEELKKQIEQLQQDQQAQNSQRSSSQMSRDGKQSSSSSSSQGQSGQSQGKQGGQSASQQAQQQRLQQLMDEVSKAQQAMRDSQRAEQQGNQGQASAQAQAAADRLNQAAQAGTQLKRDGVNSGLGDVAQRAQQMADRQQQMENQLKGAYRGNTQKGQSGLSPQERQQMAAEKEDMLNQLKSLTRDAQTQARQLTDSQPSAAKQLRDGISEVQQAEAEKRLEYGSQYLRQGSPSDIAGWVSREQPLTESLQKLAEAARGAQGSLREGNQQGKAGSDLERQIASLEQTRAALERAIQQGQQGQNGQGKQGQGGQGKDGQGQGKDGQGKDGQGQQAKGGQGQGKDGQGKDGQGQGQGQGQGKDGQGQGQGGQQGGNQQGGGQNGGNQYGGNGGGQYDRFGRYNPQGMYDRGVLPPVDPTQIARQAQRDVQAIRQATQGNRELTGQVAEVERALQNLTMGNPSGPELQDRLARTVLPQLETLEVGLRQELAKTQGGQVRSPATDRTPAGFAPAVEEYYRKLSRTK